MTDRREKIDKETSREKMTRKVLEQATKEELIELVLALVARVEELERKLGMNSSNSSKPPSTDPPQSKNKSRKKKSKRKRGGQPGHEGHHRELLPLEEVDKVNHVKPCACGRCGGSRLREIDLAPRCHQVWNLPEIKPIVEAWLLYTAECKDCGAMTTAELPQGVPPGAFGPRLLATISVLSGVYRLSKRCVEGLLSDLFHLPISLGSVPACEAAVSQVLEEPVEEAREYVQSASVLNADETGWRECNKKAWLWVASTCMVTVFMIHLKRGQEAAKKLLGKFAGVLVSDRWSAYNIYTGLRQFCWAHLIRDFTAFSELGGKAGRIGSQLVVKAEKMFHWWHRVRDGTMNRKTFQRYMIQLRIDVEDLLIEGEICGRAKMSRSCKRILKRAECLWTFVDVEGVEPTNNIAERMVRHGVMWRKGSFGTQSEQGSRFVERIMTAAATCKQQDRNIVEYLNDACVAYLHGQPAPSLLPEYAFALAQTA